jgi:transposase InsO family protein
VTEISPTRSSGCSKVAVIGNLFTRFMVAVPVRDEKAETIAEVLFDRWIAIFGPPLRLLSDRGKPFVSSMVKCFCAKVGKEKIETAPYHPQSDGCVERFNRTLCDDLAK